MKVAIILFPGTNCETDTKYAFEKLGAKCDIVWHKRNEFNADIVVLPGGFSYGDYLRTGAIAKFSPVMKSVIEHIKKGAYVLGICNGFQILLEMGLLEGAMQQNANLNFISKMQYLKVKNNNNNFLRYLNKGQIIKIPIAHGQGNYFADKNTLKYLRDEERILLTYCDENGNDDPVNGSLIAGICDKNKKIFGLMPHPERACEKILGSDDGLLMIKGLFC